MAESDPDENLVEAALRWLERYEAGENPSAPDVCPLEQPELLPEVENLVNFLRRMEAFRRGDPSDPAVAPSAGPLPSIPGYELLEELGRGGMGVVYKARQINLNRLVALKMILAGRLAGARDVARFRQEVETIAHLQHPNIVHVYITGETDGVLYFVMEYVEGGSLVQRLRGELQPIPVSMRLVETLARAVHYAHCQGIVHRDLKPANVLLTKDGVLKITDFGLAKRLDGRGAGTQSGDVVGTPSYMAPEQAARGGSVGPATDVYALGAILYECLTGRPPFRAETIMETLLQVRSQEPVAPRRHQPQVPRNLETICLKCLEKEPARRYASAEALAEDLRCARQGRPIRARPVGPVARAWKRARRTPAIAALIGVAALAGLALLVGLLYQLSRPSPGAGQAGPAALPDDGGAREPQQDEKLSEAEAFRYLQKQGGQAWRDQEGHSEILTPADLSAHAPSILRIKLPSGTEKVAGVLERLTGFPELKRIDASMDGLTDDNLKHILKARKLEDLYLAGRGITDAGLEVVRLVPKLESLELYETQVTGEGLRHLKGKDLSWLSLLKSPVSDAGLEHLKELPNLRHLKLSGTRITDKGLKHLQPLKLLVTLYMAVTEVSDAGLEHLKGLSRLNDLCLDDTRVSDRGLVHFEGLTKLRHLQLRRTAVTDAGVERLQPALPNTKIYYP